MSQDLLLAEPEAAARLTVSPRTLREIRRKGDIRYVQLTVRKIAYRLSDLEEYIAARLQIAQRLEDRPNPTKRVSVKRHKQGVVVPFSRRKG